MDIYQVRFANDARKVTFDRVKFDESYLDSKRFQMKKENLFLVEEPKMSFHSNDNSCFDGEYLSILKNKLILNDESINIIRNNNWVPNPNFYENPNLIKHNTTPKKSTFEEKTVEVPNARPEVETAEETRIGCRCQKSNCLRLHCRCFKDLLYCAVFCKCLDCFNKIENDKEREYVINKTREIYPNAFKTKVISLGSDKINFEGCNCSKGCNRNYCECFKNKLECSNLCRCSTCSNNKVDKADMVSAKIVKMRNRKKDKIIIKKESTPVYSITPNLIKANVKFEKFVKKSK